MNFNFPSRSQVGNQVGIFGGNGTSRELRSSFPVLSGTGMRQSRPTRPYGTNQCCERALFCRTCRTQAAILHSRFISLLRSARECCKFIERMVEEHNLALNFVGGKPVKLVECVYDDNRCSNSVGRRCYGISKRGYDNLLAGPWYLSGIAGQLGFLLSAHPVPHGYRFELYVKSQVHHLSLDVFHSSRGLL